MVDARLADVARRIEAESGIKFTVFPKTAADRVTASINRATWSEAVDQLLAGFSRLLVNNADESLRFVAVIDRLGTPSRASALDAANNSLEESKFRGASPSQAHQRPDHSTFVLKGSYLLELEPDEEEPNDEQALRKAAPGLLVKLRTSGPQVALVSFRDSHVDAFVKQFSGAGSVYADATEFALRVLKATILDPVGMDVGTVVTQYSHLPIVAIRLQDEQQLLRLLRQRKVSSASENHVSYPSGSMESLPHINQTFVRAVSSIGGAGTSVVILDSGIDLDDPRFDCGTGHVYSGYDQPGLNYPDCHVALSIDVSGDYHAGDQGRETMPSRHGTNVAAIVASVAPEARIISYDVFPRYPAAEGDPHDPDTGIVAAWESVWLAGMNWSVAHKYEYNIVAVNMSFGSPPASFPCTQLSNYYAPHRAAIAQLINYNIVPIAASGNAGGDYVIDFPACMVGVVAVGAVDSLDRVESYTNMAADLDYLAPIDSSNGFNGTSAATPYVAGAVALLRSSNAFPNDGVGETTARLSAAAISITDKRAGYVPYETPRIDVARALELTNATVSPDPRALRASDDRVGVVHLEWVAAPHVALDDPTSEPAFDIYRRDVRTPPPAQLLAGNIEANSFDDYSAGPGIRYHYWVRRAGSLDQNGIFQNPDAGPVGDVEHYHTYDSGVARPFAEVAGGNYHSLVALDSGRIWAWGSNGAGQLGDATQTDSSVPVVPLLPDTSSRIFAADLSSSFAVMRSSYRNYYVAPFDGSPAFQGTYSGNPIELWGANTCGYLRPYPVFHSCFPYLSGGIFLPTTFLSPVEMDFVPVAEDPVWGPRSTQPTIRAIIADQGLIALTMDHRVLRLGSSLFAQKHYQIQPVAGAVAEIARSAPVNVVRLADTRVQTFVDKWEYTSDQANAIALVGCFETLGYPCPPSATRDASAPQYVTMRASSDANSPRVPLLGIVQIAAGRGAVLARSFDGRVFAWGQASATVLGATGFFGSDEPRAIRLESSQELTGITEIALGTRHALALKQDGTVWSWGSNDYCRIGTLPACPDANLNTTIRHGQLGQRNAQPGSTWPKLVVTANGQPLTNIVHVSAGGNTSLAVRADGAVFLWGFTPGQSGQLTAATRFVTSAGYPSVPASGEDTDADGIPDGTDDCIGQPNPDQLDADGDGYGNLCDADLNNSGLVTSADFAILRSVLNQPASASPTAAVADLNGSGTVTTADFAILRARLNTEPGPSALFR